MPSKNITHKEVVYGVDSKPPWHQLILQSFTHITMFSLLLINVVIIANLANEGTQTYVNMVSISLIFAAISTLLLAWRKSAGRFAPGHTSPPFFAASVIAAKAGGLPLVFGMTIIGGVIQMLMSPLIRYYNRFFNLQLAGLIIIFVGIWASILGINELFYQHSLGQMVIETTTLKATTTLGITVVGFISLFLMALLYFSTRLRTACIFVGMLLGWVIAYLFGLLDPESLSILKSATWFSLPHFAPSLHFNFNVKVLMPFVFAGILSALQLFALIGCIDELNSGQKQPSLPKQASRGNLTAGLSNALCGLCGGIPQAPLSDASLGAIMATGVLSRLVAIPYAIIAFVLAFSPKFALLFTTIPSSVNAAAILFTGAIMFIKGLMLLKIDHLPDHKQLAFGLALILAISSNIFKLRDPHNTTWITWLTDPALIIGMITFIGLSIVFSMTKNFHKT